MTLAVRLASPLLLGQAKVVLAMLVFACLSFTLATRVPDWNR